MAMQRAFDLEDRQYAKDNPTVIKSEVDYKALVSSAQEAGINPLTALRNGGSAGFSASSQPSAPLSRTAPTRQAPHLGVATRLAPAQGVAMQSSALGSGIGGFLDNFDPFQDSKRELEYDLVNAQIANLNSSTLLNQRQATVPTWGATAREQRPSGQAARLSKGADWLEPPTSQAALPVWVPGVDRDGKKMWIPNPDGPDIEQLAFGLAARSQSGWEAAARSVVNDKVKVTKIPAKEQKRMAEESWLPSWVPRVQFNWK